MTGQTTLNLAKLGNTGVLEFNIGEGGSLFNLGTGGTDVSYNTLATAYKGIGDFAQNKKIRESGVDKELRAAMRTLYSGDDKTKELYNDILEYKAMLTTGSGQGYEGYTSSGSDGIRHIDLNMDGKSALDLSVLLSHEAYRDGNYTGEINQKIETQQAVLGHMSIASSLQSSYGAGYLSESNNLEAKMYNYYQAGLISEDYLTDYADQNYDSSGDFWKVTLDEDGKVVEVLDDGDKDTITYVDQYGNVQSINRNDKSSLSGQIGHTAALLRGEENPDFQENKLEVNQIMIDSGLGFSSEKGGWYAKTPTAIDYGSGYDPIYEAIKNGQYSNISDIISNLGNNSQTDISQEDVEKALGLKTHSACAITASAEMTNNYLSALYGESLTSEMLLEAIRNSQGEMFNEESWVESFNGINANVAAELGLDNYLIRGKNYNSLEELQADGIEYYLEKHIDVNDPDHTHFTSWSNGFWDDTDTTTDDRWWLDSDLHNSVYYGFEPKY